MIDTPTEGPLLAWLLEALRPMNRTRVKQLLRHGLVSVNGATITRHDHPLHPGDRVEIARTPAPSGRSLQQAGVSIILEDDALIVIDKPPGLLSVATESVRTDTAFARLNAYLGEREAGRPFVVHRLDRETSGLLLFARNAEIRDRLQANWDKVIKTYLAVVEGRPRLVEGVVEKDLFEDRNLRVRVTRQGGRRAVTRYRVIAESGEYTLMEIGLETGRKHQIRVHLAGIGCPVIGDPLYGKASNPAGRLGLHAWRLTLDHPITGKRLELESPLPKALRRIVFTRTPPPS